MKVFTITAKISALSKKKYIGHGASPHLYVGLRVFHPELRWLAGFAKRLGHEAGITRRPRPLLHQLENKGELIKIRQYVTCRIPNHTFKER